MEKFLAAVRNMFNVPDLRRRIWQGGLPNCRDQREQCNREPKDRMEARPTSDGALDD